MKSHTFAAVAVLLLACSAHANHGADISVSKSVSVSTTPAPEKTVAASGSGHAGMLSAVMSHFQKGATMGAYVPKVDVVKPATASVSVTKSADHSVDMSKVMPSVSITKSAAPSMDMSKAMPSVSVSKSASAGHSMDISKAMPSISVTKSAAPVTVGHSIDFSKSMPSVSVSKVVAAPAEKKGDSAGDVMRKVNAMLNMKAAPAVIVGAKAESKPAAAAVSETKSAGHSIDISMPSVSVTKTAEVVAPTTFSKSVQASVAVDAKHGRKML